MVETKFKKLAWLALLCFVIATGSMTLPNSIAARNISLACGALTSAYFISTNFKVFFNNSEALLPAYLLFALIVWIAVLYFFFPTDPIRQFRELGSLWLRAFLAIVLGIGVGFLATKKRVLLYLCLSAVFLPAILYLLLYLIKSYQSGGIITTAFNGIFITKAGATYFLMWPFLIICGYLSYLFSKGVEEIDKLYLFKIFSSAIILALIFLAFFTLHSLNGLLVSSIIALLLIIRISIFGNKISSHKKLSIFITLSLISAAIFTLYGNTKNDNGKLENLFRDIQVGKEIDLYPNWRNYTHTPWTPQLGFKTPVNQSTYYRVANAIEGLRLLKDHPLGAGFTFLPYGYYLSRLYPGSQSDHTHSGWIDFALGAGIPGLMLCWSAFLLITYNAIKKLREKNYKLWAHITIWSLGGIFLLWIFLEVSEKEYIEHLVLMLSLFSAGLMVSDKRRS